MNKAATKHRMSTKDTRAIRDALSRVLQTAELAGSNAIADLAFKALRSTGKRPEMLKAGAQSVGGLAGKMFKVARGHTTHSKRVSGRWSHVNTRVPIRSNAQSLHDARLLELELGLLAHDNGRG